MAPLTVAGSGWVLVAVTVSIDVGSFDVAAAAAGWALVCWGWYRLRLVQPPYEWAWRVAAAAGVGALAGLIPGPDSVALMIAIGYAALTVVALSLGAYALQQAAHGGRASLAAGQASFLCWAGVGVLVAGAIGSVGSVAAAAFDGLVLSAALVGILLALWFALLQLLCARRAYVRTTRAT
ncbi:MAG: hypothetical protein M3Q87_09810 [Actinomycetota bacterium]|nr:hypothetical protein [Actinomycetota bacterium]